MRIKIYQFSAYLENIERNIYHNDKILNIQYKKEIKYKKKDDTLHF